MALRLAAVLVLALVGGCATAAARAPASGEQCVGLFRTYDVVEATMSTPSGQRDRMVIPPALQWPILRLRAAGCLTTSDELALDAAAPPVASGGPAIAPVGLHAGVVTSMEDDAAAQAFFEARGVRARSVGAPGLGRRIYLGPFATRGALEDARGLALEAGFASPYPANF